MRCLFVLILYISIFRLGCRAHRSSNGVSIQKNVDFLTPIPLNIAESVQAILEKSIKCDDIMPSTHTDL